MRKNVSVCAVLMLCQAIAKGSPLDVREFLPLLERNSIERKIVDVTYFLTYRYELYGQVDAGRKKVHLVFDGETQRYREETQYYHNPDEVQPFRIDVGTWNGKEYVLWTRYVSDVVGQRVLDSGRYEDSGTAVIMANSGVRIPPFAEIFYDYPQFLPFCKTVPDLQPKMEGVSENTLFIDTTRYRLGLNKTTGSIESITFHQWDAKGKRSDRYTDFFSDHVERSGIWIPLRVTRNEHFAGFKQKEEYVVDSKTLRLLDKVDDALFDEPFSSGCIVNDQIRKKGYIATTLDTHPPQDEDALRKMLDTMIGQAEEQRTSVEKK